jgi:hypothetical protein
MRLPRWTWLLIAVAAACILVLALMPWVIRQEPPADEPTIPTVPTEPTIPTEPPGAEPEETPPPEYELDNVPEGAVFDPETRTFSWIPGEGDAGIYLGVCFRVTDPGGLYDEECINIIVLDDNLAPSLSPIPLKVVDSGGVVTFTLQANDPDGDGLTFFAKNLPPGAVFTPPVFSWLAEEPGVWPGLVFGVTDGKEKVTQRVIIAVR